MTHRKNGSLALRNPGGHDGDATFDVRVVTDLLVDRQAVNAEVIRGQDRRPRKMKPEVRPELPTTQEPA